MHDQGDITLVQCIKCRESFPVFVFSGETDMLTSGCAALTGAAEKDIVITYQAASESDVQLEQRIGNGYKVVAVFFEKQNSEATTSGSFQSFLKNYIPPKAVYQCIYCGSNTEIIGQESKEEFLLHGKLRAL